MYKNADFIKRQREIHLRTSRGSKTHKGSKRVTRVQCSWIFIFLSTIFGNPRWRPQKNNLFNNNIARPSRFFVNFFAATARLRRESAYFHVLWRANSRGTLRAQSSSVCTNDFMGILHPREQNFHPAKCSTIFNRLNTWEQAPGANNAPSCVLTRAKWS